MGADPGGVVPRRLILPAFTCPATLAAIRMAGAEPFLVDVRPDERRMPAWTVRAGVPARPVGSRDRDAVLDLERRFRMHPGDAAGKAS